MGIIILNTAVDLNPDDQHPRVDTIPLCAQEPADDDVLIAAGWGWTRPDGGFPLQLQRITLPKVTRPDCIARWGTDLAIIEDMLCAGGLQGHDVCKKGDSYFYQVSHALTMQGFLM